MALEFKSDFRRPTSPGRGRGAARGAAGPAGSGFGSQMAAFGKQLGTATQGMWDKSQEEKEGMTKTPGIGGFMQRVLPGGQTGYMAPNQSGVPANKLVDSPLLYEGRRLGIEEETPVINQEANQFNEEQIARRQALEEADRTRDGQLNYADGTTSALAEQYGISQPDLDRQGVSEYHASQGVNIPQSNALSQAMFKTQEAKQRKKDKLKKTLNAVKEFALEEGLKKIPFSNIAQKILFPKHSNAHDAIDSFLEMGGTAMDTAMKKMFGDKTVKARFQPLVPISSYHQELPSESINVPQYRDGKTDDESYRGDWRDKQIIKDFRNRHKMNALQQAMMRRHEELKYGNITGRERPGKWEMDQSQKELDYLNSVQNLHEEAEKWDEIQTRRTMGGNIWRDSHFRNQAPNYEDGSTDVGNDRKNIDSIISRFEQEYPNMEEYSPEDIGAITGYREPEPGLRNLLARVLPGGESGYRQGPILKETTSGYGDPYSFQWQTEGHPSFHPKYADGGYLKEGGQYQDGYGAGVSSASSWQPVSQLPSSELQLLEDDEIDEEKYLERLRRKEESLRRRAEYQSPLESRLDRIEDYGTTPIVGQRNAYPASSFDDGGTIQGPSHEQGGVNIEVEGGEVIIPAYASANVKAKAAALVKQARAEEYGNA